jgi:hypothetical protein
MSDYIEIIAFGGGVKQSIRMKTKIF